MPAAAHRNAEIVPHRFLDGVHHLLGGADQAHVVGLAGKSLVESPADEVPIARVIWSDLFRRNARVSQ